jgi:hypothetical protein
MPVNIIETLVLFPIMTSHLPLNTMPSLGLGGGCHEIHLPVFSDLLSMQMESESEHEVISCDHENVRYGRKCRSECDRLLQKPPFEWRCRIELARQRPNASYTNHSTFSLVSPPHLLRTTSKTGMDDVREPGDWTGLILAKTDTASSDVGRPGNPELQEAAVPICLSVSHFSSLHIQLPT